MLPHDHWGPPRQSSHQSRQLDTLDRAVSVAHTLVALIYVALVGVLVVNAFVTPDPVLIDAGAVPPQAGTP